jgi:hypothetical protein
MVRELNASLRKCKHSPHRYSVIMPAPVLLTSSGLIQHKPGLFIKKAVHLVLPQV